MFGTQSKFDAYYASVPCGVEMLRQTLQNAFAPVSECMPAKPMNSYKQSVSWVTTTADHLELVAQMMWGGVNPHPHVFVQSDRSIALSELLRRVHPVHRVARLDVCVDMGGEGTFDECFRAIAATSKKFERLTGSRHLADNPEDGSTYYLGRRGSPLYLRLYEKDKQMAKLTGDPVWRSPPFRGWTRLELEVRPEKAFKSVAATLPADAFWGCSAWTRDVSERILALHPEPISMKPTRIADHERAMRALTSQYGTTLRRHLERTGSVEGFLDDLLRRLAIEDLQKAA